MRTVTRIPAIGRPGTVQRGPIMKSAGLFMHDQVLVELGNKGDVRTSTGPGTLTLDYQFSRDEQYQVVVARQRDGKVACNWCTGIETGQPITWCLHMRYIAANSLDSNLWALPGDTEELTVMVPIIPSEGIFAKLHLRHTEPKYESNAVLLSLANMETESLDDIHIGFLHRQRSGIAEMRALFVDWIYGHLKDERYFYQAPRNQALEDPADVQRVNQKVSEFTRRFHIAMFGQSYGATLLAPDDADLPSV